MDAAVLHGPESLRIEDRPRPEASPGEVLVRIEACGVCTTDRHMYEGNLDVPLPVVPGHESAGEVVAVGDGVDRIATGQRVAINPSVPCHDCAKCKAGRENLCPDLTSLGGAAEHVADGSFAEYETVPAGNVEPIGDLSYETAALAEPLGCCLHGTERAGVERGESVAVVGAGPIGLLLVQTLRLSGAGPIVVSEPDDERRAVARSLGADHVVDPTATDPVAAVADQTGLVDLAIEVVGFSETLEQARAMTGAGGRTLVFGVPPEDALIEVAPFDVFYDERDLLGTYSLTPDDFRRAVTLLANDRIDHERLVTHEADLAGLEAAFERMGSNEGLKQLIRP